MNNRRIQLYEAVDHGDIKTTRYLITEIADINYTYNGREDTLLHLAVNKKNLEMVTFLIDAGIDINKKNAEGFTPLHCAAKIMNADLVRYLTMKGADVNAQTNDKKWTPLHLAVFATESEDPEILEILLSAGADINKGNDDNASPVHMLSCIHAKELPSLNKIMQVFMEYGANLTKVDKDNRTPVDYAIDNLGCTSVMEAFVFEGGISVNSDLTNGNSLLREACNKLNLPTVKFLLKNGANINEVYNNNITLLQVVIDSLKNYHEEYNTDFTEYNKSKVTQTMELLKYLLKWNPNVNTITTDGRNIFSPWNHLDLPEFFWQPIVQHLCKLCAINISVHPVLLDTITNNSMFKVYFEQCKQELEMR